MIVAVIGKGADCMPHTETCAEAAGRAVALAGYTLVTGGLGGAMAAASRGAAAEGGIVLGLIPAGRQPNEWVGIPIRTGLTEPYRNVLLASTVDAAFACWGGHGTRQELAHMAERSVPVAQVGTDIWPDLTALEPDAESMAVWLDVVLSR